MAIDQEARRGSVRNNLILHIHITALKVEAEHYHGVGPYLLEVNPPALHVPTSPAEYLSQTVSVGYNLILVQLYSREAG